MWTFISRPRPRGDGRSSTSSRRTCMPILCRGIANWRSGRARGFISERGRGRSLSTRPCGMEMRFDSTDAGAPDRPADVFTGDTLFVGDVGRPDLSANHTPQQLAGLLYRSLHEKLLTLPDETRVYPAHGAGSLCGRSLGTESFSTIGAQKKTNYALQARTSEDFVHLLTDNLSAAPEYFAQDVDLNRRGAAPLGELPAPRALTAAEVVKLEEDGAVVVDTRASADFAAAHVPGSIHISLTGQYASWTARILGLGTTIVIVGEDVEHIRESQLRLARVGIEKVAGYLEGGVAGWVGEGFELESIPQITAQDLAAFSKPTRASRSCDSR